MAAANNLTLTLLRDGISEDLMSYLEREGERVFPGVGQRTYRVPPVRFNPIKVDKTKVERTYVLDLPTETEQQNNVAENLVCGAFEQLSGRMLKNGEGPMFIITNFEYDNYLNKVDLSHLVPDSPPAPTQQQQQQQKNEEEQHPVAANNHTLNSTPMVKLPRDVAPRGELDGLLLHRDAGVVLVQTKAVGYNFKLNRPDNLDTKNNIQVAVTKAVKQLSRDRHVMSYVMGEIGLKDAHMTSLVALPNISRDELFDSFGDEERKNLVSDFYLDLNINFLCSDNFKRDDNNQFTYLYSWWKDVLMKERGKKGGLQEHLMKQIAFRTVGLLSTVSVWSLMQPRVEVRTLHDATVETGNRYTQVILSSHQAEVLKRDDQFLYIWGTSGSGKTLILSLKGRFWLRKGCVIVILNTRLGSKGRVVGRSMGKSITRYANKPKRVICVDFDLNDDVKVLKTELDNQLAEFNKPGKDLPIGFICDEVTWTVPSNRVMTMIQETYPNIRIWCAGMLEQFRVPGFECQHMKDVIRCPPSVQRVLRMIDNDKTRARSYITDSITAGLPTDGPRPFFVIHSQHGDPDVKPLDCKVCAQQVADFLKNELKIQQRCPLAVDERVQGKGGDASSVILNMMASGDVSVTSGRSGQAEGDGIPHRLKQPTENRIDSGYRDACHGSGNSGSSTFDDSGRDDIQGSGRSHDESRNGYFESGRSYSESECSNNEHDSRGDTNKECAVPQCIEQLEVKTAIPFLSQRGEVVGVRGGRGGGKDKKKQGRNRSGCGRGMNTGTGGGDPVCVGGGGGGSRCSNVGDDSVVGGCGNDGSGRGGKNKNKKGRNRSGRGCAVGGNKDGDGGSTISTVDEAGANALVASAGGNGVVSCCCGKGGEYDGKNEIQGRNQSVNGPSVTACEDDAGVYDNGNLTTTTTYTSTADAVNNYGGDGDVAGNLATANGISGKIKKNQGRNCVTGVEDVDREEGRTCGCRGRNCSGSDQNVTLNENSGDVDGDSFCGGNSHGGKNKNQERNATACGRCRNVTDVFKTGNDGDSGTSGKCNRQVRTRSDGGGRDGSGKGNKQVRIRNDSLRSDGGCSGGWGKGNKQDRKRSDSVRSDGCGGGGSGGSGRGNKHSKNHTGGGGGGGCHEDVTGGSSATSGQTLYYSDVVLPITMPRAWHSLNDMGYFSISGPALAQNMLFMGSTDFCTYLLEHDVPLKVEMAMRLTIEDKEEVDDHLIMCPGGAVHGLEYKVVMCMPTGCAMPEVAYFNHGVLTGELHPRIRMELTPFGHKLVEEEREAIDKMAAFFQSGHAGNETKSTGRHRRRMRQDSVNYNYCDDDLDNDNNINDDKTNDNCNRGEYCGIGGRWLGEKDKRRLLVVESLIDGRSIEEIQCNLPIDGIRISTHVGGDPNKDVIYMSPPVQGGDEGDGGVGPRVGCTSAVADGHGDDNDNVDDNDINKDDSVEDAKSKINTLSIQTEEGERKKLFNYGVWAAAERSWPMTTSSALISVSSSSSISYTATSLPTSSLSPSTTTSFSSMTKSSPSSVPAASRTLPLTTVLTPDQLQSCGFCRTVYCVCRYFTNIEREALNRLQNWEKAYLLMTVSRCTASLILILP